MKTKDKVVLFVWDNEEHFLKNLSKLGKDSFKWVFRIESLDDFEKALSIVDNDLYIHMVVHMYYSDKLRGVEEFSGSGIIKKYPKLNIRFISDGSDYKIINELLPELKVNVDIKKYVGNRIQNYSDVRESLEAGKIKIVSKKDLLSLKTKKETMVGNNRNKKKSCIFLSHSSKDKDIVEKFRDKIFIHGLNFDIDKIKFTSSDASGIAGGIKIPDDLANFLKNETGLFIQFISKNYIDSRVCLDEEGAGWVLFEDKMFIPIILDDSTFDDISWIKKTNKGISISKKTDLFKIYDDRKSFFKKSVNVANLNEKIDEFLKSL